MELYQRKGADGRPLSPFWYFDVVVNGKRLRKSTKKASKPEAKKVMLKVLSEAQQEAAKGPKRLTVFEATQGYHKDLLARRKTSSAHQAHLIAVKTFGQPAWTGAKVFTLSKALMVDEITEPMLEELKSARRSEGVADATLGQELKLLRSACMWAARNGNKPAVVRWNVPKGAKRMRWLTMEEFAAVFAAMDPQRPRKVPLAPSGFVPPEPRLVEERTIARDLLVALVLSGGRWSEVSRITTDQVLPGEPMRLRLYAIKTGKERMVPVPPMMAEVLGRRLAIAKASGGTYLFPRSKMPTTPPKDADAPPREWRRSSRAIRDGLDRAGVNAPHIVERHGRATVHSLRHTFATWLRQNGASLGDIKELLGHESEAMTMRYAHIAPEATVDMASRILTERVEKAFLTGTNESQTAS